MKLAFTGSTGNIGGQALKQALSDDRITNIVNLVRRQTSNLPDVPKLKTIVVQDFNNFDQATRAEIVDADAMIWAMGTFTGDPVVHVDYPTSFFQTITSSGSFRARTTPFRFVYLGGAFTEPNQDASLWYYAEPRRLSGLAQTTMLKLSEADEAAGKWKTYVIKPGGVLPAYKDANILEKAAGWAIGAGCASWNDEVGKALVNVAVEGHEKTLVSSRRIAEMAKSG